MQGVMVSWVCENSSDVPDSDSDTETPSTKDSILDTSTSRRPRPLMFQVGLASSSFFFYLGQKIAQYCWFDKQQTSLQEKR